MDGEQVNAITWEAYPHNPTPKGADWFWAVGIIAVALFVAALLLGKILKRLPPCAF